MGRVFIRNEVHVEEDVFIRNEVHVEEDAGGLEVSGTLLGWLMLLIWAPFSGFLLANHLACCPYLI